MAAATLTPKQREANRLLASPARNVMLRGGSRSGKTFLLVRALIQRAINAPGSRHAIFRFRFNHAKTSIWADTMPKVLKLCFPDLRARFDKTDFYVELPNGSQIWIGGLDDKERVEKILGAEYVTLYFNESSQIPWGSVEMAMSRLAQKCELDPEIAKVAGRKYLNLKAYFDCVSGDTVLDGQSKTIAELASDGHPITVMTTHGPRMASAPWINGYGEVFTVTTSSGRTIRATASHRFWTRDGWKRLDAIPIGHELLCTSGYPSRDDGLDDRHGTRTPSDLTGNCCKHPHRYDEPPLPEEDRGQACPASSCDAAQHTQFDHHHDELGCHKARHNRPSILHSHHIRWSHELPSRVFGEMIAYMKDLFSLQISGSSQRKSQSDGQCRKASSHLQSIPEPQSICYPRLTPFWCLRSALDAASIGRQWLRYTLRHWLSPDPKVLGNEGRKSLLAFDAPIIEGCEYETVVDISQPTTIAFYTVDVPFSRHYLANGFVSHNCNPPSKLHWSYALFRAKLKPGTKEALPNPDDYVEMKVNPSDNAENLPAEYFEVLASMSAAKRLRFEAGEWATEVNGALWTLEDRTADDGRVIPGIDSTRMAKADIPEMRRIVVSVDPSGTKGDDSGDDIGIVVAGLGVDGRAYVLEDATCNMSPEGWARRVVDRYHHWGADRIVAERNFGGDMVRSIIMTADKRASYKEVTASRGKSVRAEPVAALYEQGRVSHVGEFPDLEDQLCNFTASGYIGDKSPDRADAMVWALTELMLGDAGVNWDAFV